jgi:septum formation protein|tara:strand:+ start:28323 stop:28931 length:609 start_codon:yes stop_codon:yes gene_type:complete
MSISQQSLILASTSQYRREILAKLTLPFIQVRPDFDEIPIPGEAPVSMAERFAAGKALAVASDSLYSASENLVIGSDQVVVVNNQILGKPGNLERARAQLLLCSDQWVTYTSAFCIACGGAILVLEHDDYAVKFRPLSGAEIDRYLALEQPYDCAGSIKAEGLGIALMAETRGQDVNTLYGLPLMRLAQRLREHQIDPLKQL